MTHAERETEVKLRVGVAFVLPELAGCHAAVEAVSAEPTQALVADYYDTADLALARDGITLRRRVGGPDAGWHLKLPLSPSTTGLLVREELHLPLDVSTGVPEELARLLTARLRDRPLHLVATLETTRQPRVLRDAEGGALAEVTLDLVSARRGASTVELREIEVEDRGGGQQVLRAVEAVLVAAGAVEGLGLPKLVQAVGAEATAQPDVPLPARVRRSSSAGAVVAEALRRHVRAVLDQDLAVRRHQPDAVHQLRVACRRLRSDLRTFAPVVDRAWVHGVRAELSWLAAVLGGARDAEVLRERLLDAAAELPPERARTALHVRIAVALSDRQSQAEAAVAEALESRRYVALVQQLADAARTPPLADLAQAPGGRALGPRVLRAWKRLDLAAAEALADGASDELLHAARIAAKRARYGTESVAPVYGKKARRLAARAERVQEVLGEQHDAVVAAAVLEQLARPVRSAREAFLLGVLHQRQLDKAAAAAEEFRSWWRKGGAPKRGWLRPSPERTTARR